MTDNSNPAPTGDSDKPQEQPNNGLTPISSLPPDIQDYIGRLRKSDEEHRKAQKAAEQAAAKAQEEKLIEQQQWKALADQRAAELERLKPVAEKYETIEQAFNASLETRLKDIPADIRKSLVDPARKGMSPVEFSDWLDANKTLLSVKPAPPLDGGAGGQRTTNAVFNLTPEQIEMANAGGIPLDVYAKRLAEIEERKRQTRKG